MSALQEVTTAHELSVFYIQKYVVGPFRFNFIFIQQTFVPTDYALFQKNVILESLVRIPLGAWMYILVLFACFAALV